MKGLHHIHLRKRKADHYEPFPARKAYLRFLDRVVLVVGIIGPLTAVPQIIKIYALRNAAGVSMLSWVMPAFLDIPWVIYGLVYRERPIVITYVLWILADLSVAVGILLYGGGTL